jgi:hypothetical protein
MNLYNTDSDEDNLYLNSDEDETQDELITYLEEKRQNRLVSKVL